MLSAVPFCIAAMVNMSTYVPIPPFSTWLLHSQLRLGKIMQSVLSILVTKGSSAPLAHLTGANGQVLQRFGIAICSVTDTPKALTNTDLTRYVGDHMG